jgi:peptidoglycan pentaglycine glycine transferase (the first glycine)
MTAVPDVMSRNSRPDATTTAAAHEDRWTEWDQFVAAHPHGGFMQSASWIRCRAEDGYGHIAIMLRDDTNRLVGGAIVGRWAYGNNQAFHYIQEGPLLPDEPELAEAVMNALLARLAQHGRDDTAVVSHLRIEPRRVDWPHYAAAGFASPRHDDRFREPRHTHCVNRRATEHERLLAMKPKGRYNVGLARRHGVAVVEDNTDRGLDDFLAIRDDTARRQDLKRRSHRYFADMRREFGPPRSLRALPPEGTVSGFGRAGSTDGPRAHFFFAELAGRRLACALVIRFGERATYLYGGSLDEQRDVMAPHLLHHEIMNRMAAAGCTCYDLWGTAPPGKPEHDWAGISAFKRKFGGTDIAHVPTLDYIYDHAAYAGFVDAESKPARRTRDCDERTTEDTTERTNNPMTERPRPTVDALPR